MQGQERLNYGARGNTELRTASRSKMFIRSWIAAMRSERANS